jgi:hypothetical protein
MNDIVSQMKIKIFLLLLIIPFFTSNAAPRSFFIPSGLSIEIGTILKTYSLELEHEGVSAANLAELSEIIGLVTVSHSGETDQQKNMRELISAGAVRLVPHYSGDYIEFQFTDTALARIKTGNEGISFCRSKTSDYETKLIANNIQIILALEKQGLVHSAIQERIRRNRIFNLTRVPESLTIDFQTTEKDNEKLKSAFNGTAAVSCRRGGRMFFRIDGLLNRNAEMSEFANELLTHYHTDHINQAVAEKCMKEGKYSRFIAPYPLLAASMTKTFSLLAAYADLQDQNVKPPNLIFDITPNKKPLNLDITRFGDFNYSMYNLAADITVEMFRYHKPRDVNSDGLFFCFTYKSVSYLLFGDFDDPAGLEQILDFSAANEKRRIEIMEEISILTIQLIKAQAENKPSADIQGRIDLLNVELSGLFILKADVMKWPHHAHRFPNNQYADDIVRKMNQIIDPYYIIWEPHYTQKGFTEYIQRYNFVNKFLCSDNMEIFIISMFQKQRIVYESHQLC